MISIICTTDRTDSNSMKLSQVYEQKLLEMGETCQILDLQTVPAQWIQDSAYGTNLPEFDILVEKYIRSVSKLIFVTPEYNGSFPGYVKFFMDACDYGDFAHKKVALVGLASGRSGNVRGLDHLTGIFHYLDTDVYKKKVYLSQVHLLLPKDGLLTDVNCLKEIENQLKGFIEF
ncbi:MAG: NAD(P)H-dependent oxidoreductase [Flavobacteriales bacterium]|nr:NAD(P)H-dependent oxidoreductase [Flavobacteriales bacterium]